MEQAIPTIYAPPVAPIRLSLYGRLVTLAVFVGCVTLIITAWRLSPSHSGVGTHRSMGMFPCSMLATTGIPCPSCGMTTSMAWFYKGHFAASAYVQPGGFFLAYLTAVVCLGSAYELISGRPVHRLLKIIPLRAGVIIFCSVLAFGWAWKIMIHLGHVDGW